MKAPIKETDLGRAASLFWEERGFTNYHEVRIGYGDFRADLVSVLELGRGKLVVVTECKTAMSFDVVGQAERWVMYGYANRAYVCVPGAAKHGAGHSGRAVAQRLCRSIGVGVLELAAPRWKAHGDGIVSEAVPSRLVVREARMKHKLLDALSEAQRSGPVAGSAGGGYHTPFRETCDEIRRLVAKKPGLQIKEVVAEIEHHYHRDSTARQCLLVWAKAGKIAGVEARWTGKFYAFHPAAISAGPGP